MNNVTVNLDVNGLLEALKQLGIQVADASTPYIAHLYEIYVRQQILFGYGYALGALAILIVAVVLGNSSFQAFKRDQAGWDGLFGFAILTFALGIFTTIIAALHILNPEYYALQALIAALTGVAK